MNSNDPIRTMTHVMEQLAEAAEQLRPKPYRSEDETLDDWKRRLWALDTLADGARAMVSEGDPEHFPILSATARQIEATRDWAYATVRMREAEEAATEAEKTRRNIVDGVGSVSVA